MYLPRLRTTEQVVEYLRTYDPDSAITTTLIAKLIDNGTLHAARIGRRIIINLDECIDIFYSNSSRSTTATTTAPRCMRTTGEIYRMFASWDSDTLVCKNIVRTAIRSNGINAVWLPKGFWVADVGQFVALFTNGYTYDPNRAVPRLGALQRCKQILYYLYPNEYQLEQAILQATQSKTVATIYNGNRWLINIDELGKHLCGDN